MKPTYVVPIVGEYRHQVMQKQIAMEAGFQEENIIMLENGVKITFESGKLLQDRDKIQSGDVLVDGSFVGDINEIVLKDREMLAQDGLILVVTSVDARLKKVVAGPTVEMKGFVVGDTAEEVSRAVRALTEEIIDSYFEKRYIDWTNLKNKLKEAITKEVLKLTHKNPIIMVSLIDVESNRKE